MAQKLRIKKAKQKRGPAPKTGFQRSEVAHPRERARFAEGLARGGAPLLVALFIAFILFLRGLDYLLVAVLGYLLLSAAFYVIGPEFTERKFLSIGEAGDSTRLQRMADVQARALGIAPPEVVVSALAPHVMVVGRKIAMPSDLAKELSDAERWALIAHELAHLRLGHTFWINLIRRSRQATGLMLVPALPVQSLARGLAVWEPYANASADRLALALTHDQRTLGQALLKEAAFHEPDLEISSAEIVEYLQRPGGLQAEGSEVTMHYKLGQLLQTHKDLHERLRQIAAWAGSDGYKRAVAQIEAASGRAPAKPPPAEAPPSGDPPPQPPAAGQ